MEKLKVNMHTSKHNNDNGALCDELISLVAIVQTSLLLDIHLHEHVEQLYQKIRNKALVQYFSPFISVNLNTMAQAFNTTVAGLERELSKLIMEGQIQARIDSHNKVMPHILIYLV